MLSPDDQPSRTGLEPSVNELLLYRKTMDSIESMGAEELRAMCRLLAQQAMLIAPAQVRFLAREAAGASGTWIGGEALCAQMALGQQKKREAEASLVGAPPKVAVGRLGIDSELGYQELSDEDGDGL